MVTRSGACETNQPSADVFLPVKKLCRPSQWRKERAARISTVRLAYTSLTAPGRAACRVLFRWLGRAECWKRAKLRRKPCGWTGISADM